MASERGIEADLELCPYSVFPKLAFARIPIWALYL